MWKVYLQGTNEKSQSSTITENGRVSDIFLDTVNYGLIAESLEHREEVDNSHVV